MLKIKKNKEKWVSRDTLLYFNQNPNVWRALNTDETIEIMEKDYETIKEYVHLCGELSSESAKGVKEKIEMKRAEKPQMPKNVNIKESSEYPEEEKPPGILKKIMD